MYALDVKTVCGQWVTREVYGTREEAERMVRFATMYSETRIRRVG